ncbi:sulfate transporter [Mycobacterium sp. E2462]|uniref:STAS domain-containing protein n=1 Tax=Mycobacterium sp. E2462 TaxID=1834133 RepID=UPI0007FFB4ED|nr:STAS domain-containing protein [Mycobacterium sp. E2462]OBI05256.1 sulfate transporter [Mycobacterium sp. E2462]
MTEPRSAVRIDLHPQQEVPVLVLHGMLDSSTYRHIRDTVIKAALDEPSAVIVDVSGLSAPSASAWTVFTSARWHVSVWPDVPILLVCSDPAMRRDIVGSGVTRYVPMHAGMDTALRAAAGNQPNIRRRARAELSRTRDSLDRARAAVTDWLTDWGHPELAPVAATLSTVFVENVLDHTQSAPILIVESLGDAVTVAVQDCSERLPARHEDANGDAGAVSGLAIVSALCRSWGATPTPSGKTVWAVVGHENRF